MKKTITITCVKCGKAFEATITARNSAELERKAAWAAGSLYCDECSQRSRDELCDRAEAEHGLPELAGSEKQIAFARDLRADYITRPENAERRAAYLKAVADASSPAMLDMAKKTGKLLGSTDAETAANILAAFCRRAGLERMHTAFAETNAGRVIDALRGF